MDKKIVLRLLTEAKERVWQCRIDIDRKYAPRADTIERKLIDLIEDICNQ